MLWALVLQFPTLRTYVTCLSIVCQVSTSILNSLKTTLNDITSSFLADTVPIAPCSPVSDLCYLCSWETLLSAPFG